MDVDHDHDCESSCCCSRGALVGVAESLDELDFHKSLGAAAISNDIVRLQHLLSRGSPPNALDVSGYSPLHYAARSGHLDACLLLLENGAQVDKCTRAGKATSLHRAAYAGHVNIVKALLGAGADPLKRDVDGSTPLQKAEAQGNTEVVELLADAAAGHKSE